MEVNSYCMLEIGSETGLPMTEPIQSVIGKIALKCQVAPVAHLLSSAIWSRWFSHRV